METRNNMIKIKGLMFFMLILCISNKDIRNENNTQVGHTMLIGIQCTYNEKLRNHPTIDTPHCYARHAVFRVRIHLLKYKNLVYVE